MTTVMGTGTIGEALQTDPRIIEAKKLLLAAVKDHQQQIRGVKPPVEERRVNYQSMLDTFGKARGGKLWYPFLGSGIGNGALVELMDGSVKYDMITGIGVHYFGHSHPEMISAAIDGAISDTVMQGHLMQNKESYDLCTLLCELSGLEHAFLTTSGVMACENGLKIAFQNRSPACRVLAFEHCFMGRTLYVSQVTDKPGYRKGLPLNALVDYVPFYDDKDPKGSTKRAMDRLKDHIARYPGQHAVMSMELVQGEGGFYPGEREFFVEIMRFLKEHGILVLIDEVQSFGRTSRLFAFQHFGLEEFVDIVTIGKLSQTCATLFRKNLTPQAGLLSQTFTGSSQMIHAAKAVLKQLVNGDYYGPNGRLMKIHEQFESGLEKIGRKHPGMLSGPYGIGAMIAFTPWDGDSKIVMDLSHKLFENGVICFVCGSNPMRIRFLVPAMVITPIDIEHVLAIVEKTMVEMGRDPV